MCSTVPWQPCTSLLSARSEPALKSCTMVRQSPTHHTLRGEQGTLSWQGKGCSSGRQGTVQPHGGISLPMVHGVWGLVCAFCSCVQCGTWMPLHIHTSRREKSSCGTPEAGLGVLGRWQQGPVTTKTDKCQLYFPQNFIERCSLLAGSS